MKPITHKIIVISVFVAIVAAAALAVVFNTQETPESLNSYGVCFASAEEYDDSIDGYEVGAFGSYDAFCSSKWADVRLRGNTDSLSFYYTKRYFKEKNLVIFAFNEEYADLSFEIVDEKRTDGRCDLSAVVLYRTPHMAQNKDENGNVIIVNGDQTYTVPPEPQNFVGAQAVENQKIDTTYFYLYETEDPLAEEYSFTIVAEHFFGIDSQMYGRNTFEPALIPGEETPVMYRFSSKEEADVFVREDPFVKRFGVFLILLGSFLTNGIDDHDVIVVRFTSMANYDSWQGGYLDGTEFLLWEIEKKNSWKFSGQASYLVMISVPKDATVETLRWVSYRGKTAPEPRVEERAYRLVREDDSAIVKYNTEILP